MWLFKMFDIIIFKRINRGVGNRIHMPNTDPLPLLPTTQNNRSINNCNIIISDKNSRYTYI